MTRAVPVSRWGDALPTVASELTTAGDGVAGKLDAASVGASCSASANTASTEPTATASPGTPVKLTTLPLTGDVERPFLLTLDDPLLIGSGHTVTDEP